MKLETSSDNTTISTAEMPKKFESKSFSVKDLNELEYTALISGIISAAILIPDGLNNAYNYHALDYFYQGVKAIRLTLEVMGLSMEIMACSAVGTANIVRDGFLDATGGQAWRVFGLASLGFGIAGLALRKYEQSEANQVPSIDPSKVQVLSLN